MAQRYGTTLWHNFMAERFGTMVGHIFMTQLCGTTLGHNVMAQLYGTTLCKRDVAEQKSENILRPEQYVAPKHNIWAKRCLYFSFTGKKSHGGTFACNF